MTKAKQRRRDPRWLPWGDADASFRYGAGRGGLISGAPRQARPMPEKYDDARRAPRVLRVRNGCENAAASMSELSLYLIYFKSP